MAASESGFGHGCRLDRQSLSVAVGETTADNTPDAPAQSPGYPECCWVLSTAAGEAVGIVLRCFVPSSRGRRRFTTPAEP